MGNDKMRYDLAHPDARLNKRRLNLIGYDMNFTIGYCQTNKSNINVA